MTDTQEAIPGPVTPAARLMGIYRHLQAGEAISASEGLFLYELYQELANAITWETTCLNCARTLDHSIDEFQKREQTEQELHVASMTNKSLQAEITRLEDAVRDRRGKLMIEDQCPQCSTGIMHPAPDLDMPAGVRVPAAPAWVCQLCKTVTFRDDTSERP